MQQDNQSNQNNRKQNFQNKDQGHHDPNKERPKNQEENIIDGEGGVVREEKKWKDIDDMNPAHVDKMKEGQSPTTKMEKEGTCDGVLHMSGTFLFKHREEIMGAIKHSEEMAIERDPLDKIVNIETSPEKITIYTAKNQLAHAIGKKLDSAYKGGDLEIKWAKNEKTVDVYWQKDL